MNTPLTPEVIAALKTLTPEALAALGLKPAAAPKAPAFGPTHRLLDDSPEWLKSRARASAFKKVGFMAIPVGVNTTLADVEAGVQAYNAANPGKLEAWKARQDAKREAQKALAAK